jgi:hypothetical protein
VKRLAILAGMIPVVAAGTTGTASAVPDGFPDVSQYTETTADYIKRSTQAGSDKTFAAFRTPDGLLDCMLIRSNSAGCSGTSPGSIPGFPADAPLGNSEGMPCLAPHVGFGGQQNLTDPASPGSFPIDSYCSEGSDLPVLPVGQKVTLGPTVCLAGENRLTACTDGTHGFVVQPSGSWVF